jgi:glycosyltransferase involved in cell wall biosynthesis
VVKQKTTHKICIIIPAYNEETAISDVIADVINVFDKTPHDYEIVVVNDGSKDKTEHKAKNHNITVINHILNSGAGSATATGLSYARQKNFDIAATMDADGQHTAKDVLKGVDIALRDNVDLLIGSRLINSKGMSRVKVIGNKGLSTATYLLFGVDITDSQSGLRVFSRKTLDSLRWKTNGFEFCSEMIWRAKQLDLKIDEYPIQAIYTAYSKSKGQNNWNAVNILKSLVRRRLVEMFE